MRALVCQQRGAMSTITIYTDPETLVNGPFEAWTLLTGKQVICVERRLHKLLERHHLSGSYEKGALYAFAYDELCAVLRDQLGPSDRDRYLNLQQDVELLEHGPPGQRLRVVGHIAWRFAGVMAFVVYKSLTTVVFFGVVGLLLTLFKKHR